VWIGSRSKLQWNPIMGESSHIFKFDFLLNIGEKLLFASIGTEGWAVAILKYIGALCSS
jgi:hypothetical protein